MNLQLTLDEITPIHRPRRRANCAGRISKSTRDAWRKIARAAGLAWSRITRDKKPYEERHDAAIANPHPALAAVMASADVARLIGTLSCGADRGGPAWIELDQSGWRPILRIHYRGAQIPGEAIGTEEFVGPKGLGVRRCSKNTGATRDFSFEALIEATAAARKALVAAGVQLTGLCEVRHKYGIGQAKGAVAMIAIRDAPRKIVRSR